MVQRWVFRENYIEAFLVPAERVDEFDNGWLQEAKYDDKGTLQPPAPDYVLRLGYDRYGSTLSFTDPQFVYQPD